MKILVSITSPYRAWNIPKAYVDALAREFPQHAFVHVPDEADVRGQIPDVEVAFTSQLSAAEAGAARRLRWIHSPAAGVGSLLTPRVRNSDIIVTNSRGLHAAPMAEHVVAVSLALFRRLHEAVRRQAAREWAQDRLTVDPPPRLLRGSVVGLIGLGAIGSAVAALMSACGATVVALRRRTDQPVPPGVSRLYAPGEMPALLAAADIVVVSAPLTADTRGLIGARELRQMKRDAILVNVGRGKVLREAEVAAELAAGTIAGAALDVFEHEPLDPASPLWSLPNVIVTPHTSGLRADVWDLATRLFADNLRRFERGEPLLNLVDKQSGY